MTTWEAVAGAEVDLRAYIDHLNAHGRPEGMFSATVIAGLLAERDEALGEATRLADQLDALHQSGLTDDQLDALFNVIGGTS